MKLLILCCFVAFALAKDPPRWDQLYQVKGVLNIPYAEISEPFYGWYDQPTGRSRIDYYGGMVKTYQLTGEGQYGTSLKMAPVSTLSNSVKETCLRVNGTDGNRIRIQAILPDVRNFSLIGTVDYNGVKCDKFQLTDVIGEKKNIYTLFVKYRKSPKYPSSLQPIPVRYEMRGYNTLLGSHLDHYYLDYDYYSHDDIPGDIFEVEMDNCIGFPGPGHYATMNPMQEFVYPHDDSHVDNEFDRFKGKHGKKYETDTEHDNRKSIFRQNLRFIHSKNRAGLGYSLGINHLADRSADELKALRGFKSSKIYNGGRPFPYDADKEAEHLPDQWDWRLYGAVSIFECCL